MINILIIPSVFSFENLADPKFIILLLSIPQFTKNFLILSEVTITFGYKLFND